MIVEQPRAYASASIQFVAGHHISIAEVEQEVDKARRMIQNIPQAGRYQHVRNGISLAVANTNQSAYMVPTIECRETSLHHLEGSKQIPRHLTRCR